MENKMDRRAFLRSFIPKVDAQEQRLSLPENPFPGALFWNHSMQKFDPVFSVTKEGLPLDAPQEAEAFASILSSPPHPQAYWDFHIHKWLLPLGLDTVFMRSVLGKKIVRECYGSGHTFPEVHQIKQIIRESFSEFSWEHSTFMGLTKKEIPYPEDIITLGFNQVTDELDLHLKLLETEIPAKPGRYGIKLFLESKQKKIKAVYHEPDLIAEPAIELPDHFLWGMAHTFHKNQEEPLRDILFSARNDDVKDFCHERNIEYPENILQARQQIFGFSLTYNRHTSAIVRIKRYYLHWFT